MRGFSYDANTDSYTVSYNAIDGGPDFSGSLGSRMLSYTPADIVSGPDNFTTYRKDDPTDASLTNTLALFKTGPANSVIALTYVSYGIQTVGDGVHFQQTDFFVFGVPTSPSTLPTTGTGSWSGIVDGLYNASTLGQTYRLTGTSALTADFAAATVNASVTFTGKNLGAGGPALAAQTFSGPGGISFAGNAREFGGVLTGGGLLGGGYYTGSFFGDGAKEYGFAFNYAGPTVTYVGVAVGH